MYEYRPLNVRGTVVKRIPIPVTDIATNAAAVVTAIEHTQTLPAGQHPLRPGYSYNTIFRRTGATPPRSYSSSALRSPRDSRYR